MVMIKYIGSWQPKETKDVSEKLAKQLVKTNVWTYLEEETVIPKIIKHKRKLKNK